MLRLTLPYPLQRGLLFSLGATHRAAGVIRNGIQSDFLFEQIFGMIRCNWQLKRRFIKEERSAPKSGLLRVCALRHKLKWKKPSWM